MLNPILIISAVIAVVVIFVANIYILVYFQHEEDKNQAYFPKFVVLAGLFLAEITVLMLPFDVAVSGAGDSHRDNMELLWQIVYMALAFMLVVVIPFALFYYESWDPEKENSSAQCWHALQLELCTIVTVLLALLLMFFLLGVADIPYQQYTTTMQPAAAGYDPIPLPGASGFCSGSTYQCEGKSETLALDVSFPVYTMGLVSFVGWFFFVLFASVGLAALPLDMFSAYRFRPRKIPLDEFVRQKLDINKRAAMLKEAGEKLVSKGTHKSSRRKDKTTMNKFKKAVYFLERDWERLNEIQKGASNPFVYWGFLLLGFVSTILSVCWLVHIVLFMFLSPEQAKPFLNTMFVDLDNSFAFLGTVLYGAFSFYLVWATIKGNLKIGLRFVFFTIHPMKLGATMMNSFLFNTALILLCSVPVVQFCATAFGLYAHDTAIENLFGIQVNNLRFMRYFFLNNVFLYAMFGLCGLTFLYLLVFPTNTRGQKLKKALKDDEDAWMVM